MDTINRAFPIILIIMFQLFILALLNLSSYISKTNAFETATLTNFMFPMNLLLGFLAIVSVLIIRRTIETVEQDVRNHVQLETMKHLEDLISTMRVERHNFNHELQTVYGLLAVEEYAEAKEYLAETMSEISFTNEFIRIDNPGIGALLHVKSGQMECFGIRFKMNIKTKMECSNIKTHDVNVILANLLDNAMEAIKEALPQNPLITLDVFKHDQKYIISVSNNGPSIKPNIVDKLFNPGFSYKKHNRGMGLYIVKQTIEKYGGKITVKTDPNYTVFEVQIPIATGRGKVS